MTAPAIDPPQVPQPKPETEPQSAFSRALVVVFTCVPFAALIVAIPALWGWGLTWRDVVIAAVLYPISGLGVTIGYHRYFTHGAFKAKRPLRVALAVAGSLAMEGDVIQWVADHRKHHKYADREGDPHSPWRFGNDWKALIKGMMWAHMGWFMGGDRTNPAKYAPDLLADKDIARVSRWFPGLVATTLLLPPLIGGLWSMSWQGALTAFFWASLVRVSMLHHVTWSTNSICHVFGEEQFEVRDKARNVWWLAIPSFGESWHNLHHSDPTCARHGVLKGQLDSSARLIWVFEKLGWVYNVRWPNPERLASRRVQVEDAA